MAQDVGELLRHKHPDLVHSTAELQVAQVEARREGMAAPLVVSQLVLGRQEPLERASLCGRVLSSPCGTGQDSLSAPVRTSGCAPSLLSDCGAAPARR